MDRLFKNRRSELLSPAGSFEAALAAFAYGADAVYLGLKSFSARAEAENFDFEELGKIIAYAHSLHKKVFVTFNTLIQEKEFKEAVKILARLALLEVDALIIQDLGILRVIKTYFPQLEVHASTQLAIHNLEGALYAKELGFSRVVLARELSLPEIKNITKHSGLEIEIFIHGALCYSYSGLCLLSSHCSGNSGNRGRCRYPCRDTYYEKESAKQFLPFSMRDLALTNDVLELQDAGVASLKIEGRKKSPLYVAAVTDLYNHILNGDCSADEIYEKEESVKSIFSRPWTQFGLHGKPSGSVIDTQWTGHRGTEIGTVEGVKVIDGRRCLLFTARRALELHDGLQLDIVGQSKPFGFAVLYMMKNVRGKMRSIVSASAGDEVAVMLPEHSQYIETGQTIYCASSQKIKNEYKFDIPDLRYISNKIPLNISLKMDKNGFEIEAVSSFASHKVKIHSQLDPIQKNFEAKKAFEKLGDTQFYLKEFRLENPYNLFIPLSQLNEARREIINLMQEEFQKYLDASAKQAEIQTFAQQEETNWYLKTDQFALIEAGENFSDVKEYIYELSAYDENIMSQVFTLPSSVKSKLRIALPMIIRKKDLTGIQKNITTLASCGFDRWEISNLSHLQILRQAFVSKKKELDLTASWSCYALNKQALEEWLSLGVNKLTVSPEDDADNIKELMESHSAKLVLIAYQDTPLFTSEACPYAAENGRCLGADCKYKELELSSKQGSFLAHNKHCLTVLTNKVPFSLSGHLQNTLAKNIKIEFINKHYSLDEAVNVWQMVKNNQTIPDSHQGNFIRGLK